MSVSENKLKVSIITVVYNGARTIEQTIQSVLGQSYQNIEYIIIDGLSTDGTQDIVERYRTSIAYFVSEQDDGLYDAMNKGIQIATGDIIGIINCDDWYDKYTVENVAAFFKQNDADLVYGKWNMVMPDGKIETYMKPLDSLWYQMPIEHVSVFAKKDIYDNYGYFDTQYKLASDYDFILRLYAHNVRFGYTEGDIAYFRAGGLSTIKYKEIVKERYAVSMSHMDACPEPEKILPVIQDLYRWDGFLAEIGAREEIVKDTLCNYFNKTISSVCIFGTGYWGMLCYTALKNGNIDVTCFSDNDSSKWNTEIDGIRVVKPEELRKMNTHVLIAVKEHGDVIKQQLNNMDNPQLNSVTIKTLRNLYFESREEELC